MMKTILIILAALCLSFTEHKERTVYVGHIDIGADEWSRGANLTIEFIANQRVIARDTLQNGMTFIMSASTNTDFDIYYHGIGAGLTFLQAVKSNDKDTVVFNFKIPRKYKKHAGKVECPKCNKHDKTIRIVYGLRSIVIYKKNPPSYTTYEGCGREEVYEGGCVTSEISPQYYCKRDKLKF